MTLRSILVGRKAPPDNASARDLKLKPEVFAQIGVREYFLFDPIHDYLTPPLQGNRLLEGVYQPIEPDAEGALKSDELELCLKFVDGELVFIRTDTGERLLTAEEQLLVEAAARQQAEREVAELRAQLFRLKNEK